MSEKKRKDKITRGTSSAVMLSVVIHAVLFLLAGMLVVFTVVKKKEIEFEPPRVVERPKMKLKKPKAKVKTSSRPKKSQTILAKVNPVNMPEIQLPEGFSGGMGEGFGDGVVGGFEFMPSLGEVSVFGSAQSIGNDFVGTFYDFKRDHAGRNINMDPDEQLDVIRKFMSSGWKSSVLGRYHQAPKNLYATSVMIPPYLSSMAPPRFGDPETAGYCWLIHYKGQLVYPEDITFRFIGSADEFMAVRVNGEVVLACTYNTDTLARITNWQSSSGENMKQRLGDNHAYAQTGDWITLEAGVPLDMEMFFGEGHGGGFHAMLVVEVKGEEYETNPSGEKIFPMFKTAPPTLDQLDALIEILMPDMIDPTNGPVFCDFNVSHTMAEDVEPEPVEPPVFADSMKPESRVWNINGEDALEAEFVMLISGKVVLKNADGTVKKIPQDCFSEADLTYIELAQPPKFNIDFTKQSSQVIIELDTPFWTGKGWYDWNRQDFDYVFGTRLKQTSVKTYDHELKVEFFAIGEEVNGDNYILLDRQESFFTPIGEDRREYAFQGDTVRLTKQYFLIQNLGQQYGGYLVLVTDERGIIVDYSSSHKWLLDIIVELRRLPPGRHFNKEGARVFPPSIKRWY